MNSNPSPDVAITTPIQQATPPVPLAARIRRSLRELLWPVLLALTIFVVSHTAIAYYEVDGTSMLPTVHTGQYVLVDTLSYHFHPPQRDDVIVFRFPLDTTQNFIKRVIAIPGDTISVTNGTVILDGHTLKEPYVHLPATYSWPLHHVPANSIVVLGDNRVVSYDSHLWSDSNGTERPYVPDTLIIGRALFVYWPLNQLTLLGGSSSISTAPQ